MIFLSFYLSNNRGVAIIAVTMVLVVGALLGGAIVATTTQDVQLSERTHRDVQALYLAESAKERAYREIMDNDSFTTLAAQGVLQGVTMMGGDYDLFARTLSEPPPDTVPKVVEIVATGNMGGTHSEVTVVAEVIRENVSVWNNAIFGGAGQTGGVINGNCAIHGSVHLLGDNVGIGNNSIEALELNGTALVHNNYTGMPAALLAKVPALPTTEFGGETISTLSAKLRVKQGSVGVSGNSEIGEANIIGNGIKETMDGIYIETDSSATRWTGNQVTDGVPNPDSVQSDNGTDALYDLGDAVQFPELDQPYTDPDTGVTYTSYEQYFNLNALVIPPPGVTATLSDGELVLDKSNDALTDLQAIGSDPNLSADITVTVSGSTATITKTAVSGEVVGSLSYDNSTGELAIEGMIKVEGNLVIGQKSFPITYDGTGTICAGITTASGDGAGDVEVHSNLLPKGIFPVDDALGLMAKDDVLLATGPGDSQLSMAGAFYALDQIVSTKQNEILGTFVCNYFDMGTNVPKIYQVPELINHLPPGLIGGAPIWVTTGFDERSWQVRNWRD